MPAAGKANDNQSIDTAQRGRSLRFALFFAAMVVIPQLALAQRGYSNYSEAGILGDAFALFLVVVALNIALLVWVAKDAKARGMESPILWMALVLFTSFVGLIIYLLVRPKGRFAPCPRCERKKLLILAHCPQCGATV